MADRHLDPNRLPGLKEADLEVCGPCALCGEPLINPPHAGPSFYRVTVSHAVFDLGAISRRVGLAGVLGGSGALARVMGPDEDLAKIVDGPREAVVHEHCAGRINHLLELFAADPEGDAIPPKLPAKPGA